MTGRDKIERAREVLERALSMLDGECQCSEEEYRVANEVLAILSEPSAENERLEETLIEQAREFQEATREMRAELARLQSATIHSCHANCPRTECVQGRALRKARAARMCQPGSDGWEEAQQAIAEALGKAWPPVPGRE